MSDNQIDYDKIRQRVEKRLKQRQEFTIHLIIYLIIIGMLWFIYLSTSPGDFMWPFIPMLGWGAGLFAHGYSVYADSEWHRAARERAIQREIEREIALRGDEYLGKPKRAPSARLSDDGELLYEEDEPVERESRRRMR